MKRVMVLVLSWMCGAPLAWSAAKFTLNAGEEPEQKTWTQPAAINYVDNADGEDNWAIDVAAKVSGQPFSSVAMNMFVRGVVQRNTLSSKEVENYAFEVGAKFDLPQMGDTYFIGQGSISYNDKTTFPDPKATCTAVPLPAACIRQSETSIRPTFTVQPFRSSWENTFYVDPKTQLPAGPSWTHSILPVVTLFYDDVLDAKLNAAGVEPDGSVFGAKALVNLAFAPRFTQYRLVAACTVQYVTAFSRSDARKASFQSDSTLVTASINYEFGPRSFEGGKGWVPSLGVKYVNGDDPLTGKLDADSFTIAFGITYRNE